MYIEFRFKIRESGKEKRSVCPVHTEHSEGWPVPEVQKLGLDRNNHRIVPYWPNLWQRRITTHVTKH